MNLAEIKSEVECYEALQKAKKDVEALSDFLYAIQRATAFAGRGRDVLERNLRGLTVFQDGGIVMQHNKSGSREISAEIVAAAIRIVSEEVSK